MNHRAVVHLSLLLSLPLLAQEKTQEKKEPVKEEKAAGSVKSEASLSDLEKKFAETLTKATLVGRWRLAGDGKLGDEKEEKYTLSSVTKIGPDLWVIRARIQFGATDLTVPVPVKVYFAGDTPVISITNAGIPGLGTYTARVMVYEGFYTGTWSAPDHAGLLSGCIVKEIVKENVKDSVKEEEKKAR